MKQWKRMSRVVLSGVLALSMTLGAMTGEVSEAKTKKATLKTKSVNLKVGKTKKIKFKNKKKFCKYTFKSNKKKVAIVYPEGKIKAIRAGIAKITVKEIAKKGKGKSRKVGIVKVKVTQSNKGNRNSNTTSEGTTAGAAAPGSENRVPATVTAISTAIPIATEPAATAPIATIAVATVPPSKLPTSTPVATAPGTIAMPGATEDASTDVTAAPEQTPYEGDAAKMEYKSNVTEYELGSQEEYELYSGSEEDEYVLKVPVKEGTNITENNVVVLPAAGDEGGIAIKAESVTIDADGNYVIEGQAPQISEVFDVLQIESDETVDMSGFVYNSDILEEAEPTQELRKKTITVGENKKFEIKPTKLGEYCTMTGNIELCAPTVQVSLDADFRAFPTLVRNVNITVDQQAVGEAKLQFDSGKDLEKTSIYLGHAAAAVGATGFFADVYFYLTLSAEGEATIKCTVSDSLALNYEKKDDEGAGFDTNFDSDISFEGTEASVSGEMLFSPIVGLRYLGWWDEKKKKVVYGTDVVKVGADAGVGINAGIKVYDNKPYRCSDIDLYGSLQFHLDTDVGIGYILRHEWPGIEKTSWTVLENNESNPFRMKFHYEDGVKSATGTCSHDNQGGETPVPPKRTEMPLPPTAVPSTTRPTVTPEPVVDDHWDTNPDTSGSYTYTLSNDNLATITGYTGSSTNLNLPTSIDGYKVVGIAASAFKDNKTLSSVNIPGTIVNLGYEGTETYNGDSYFGVFQGDERLTSVTIQAGKENGYIGNKMFQGCASLKEITIPGNIKTVYGRAFQGCTSLEECSWSSTTGVSADQVIGEYAFEGDTKLGTVTLNDVKSIGTGAFKNNSALKNLTLNEGIRTIGASAFMNCTELENVVVPGSAVNLGYKGTETYNGDSYFGVFQGDERLTSVTIQAGKENGYIGNKMFQGCVSLKEIAIPGNIKTVYGRAFQGCTSLEECSWSSTTGVSADQVIGEYAFEGDTKLGTVTLNDVKSIGTGAFKNNNTLKNLTLSEGIRTIGASAFMNCTELENVVVPGSAVNLGYKGTETYNGDSYFGVFQGDIGLKHVTIKSGAENSGAYLGNRMFYGCTSLSSITFTQGALQMYGNCFYGVTATAYYPAGNSTWTNDVMQDYGGTMTWVAR